MTPVLVWLTYDLRIADNPALQRAIAANAPVIPVFIWAPVEEFPWAPGSASQRWLHRSLLALQADLEKRGSRLIIRRGPTAQALRNLTKETGATHIFSNRRVEPAIIARDRELKLETCPGNLLYEPGSILSSSGRPFQVFTAFYNAATEISPPQPTPAPRTIPAPARWPISLSVADLELEQGLPDGWEPGEAGAARQLKSFEQHVATYSTDRDRPDHKGTSRLSPHLHFGEISARQIWSALPKSEPYLRQLMWREFAHHLLFHFPHTATDPLRAEFARFPWRVDPAGLVAWTRGETGYPLVDAGMRELLATGWMHNRVRMVVASFLVKHLMIPWQEGAAWFWDTLVDADLANNTLGWQWSAGCGADAAPYFRIFNPTLQAEKFDPDGAYVRRWTSEKSYPPPIVDHKVARERALQAFATLKSHP